MLLSLHRERDARLIIDIGMLPQLGTEIQVVAIEINIINSEVLFADMGESSPNLCVESSQIIISREDKIIRIVETR